MQILHGQFIFKDRKFVVFNVIFPAYNDLSAINIDFANDYYD